MAKIFNSLKEVEEAAFAPRKIQAPTIQQEAPTLRASSEGNSSLPASQDLLTNVNSQLDELNKTNDVRRSADLLSSIKGSIAGEQAKFYKQAQISAYAEYQIPQLEQMLKQNQQMDMNTPAYVAKYGRTDSDETAAVRARLQSAKAAAQSSIDNSLAGNSTYQELFTKAKTAEAVSASIWQKNANRDEKLSFEAEQYSVGIGTEGQARAKLLNADAASDPTRFYLFMRGQPKKVQDDINTVLTAPKEDISLLALRGSPAARRILAADEMNKVGPVAKDLLREGYQIADNSQTALNKFQEMDKANVFSDMPTAEKETFLKSLNPIIPVLGDKKEGQILAANNRAKVAETYMRWKAKNDFNSDLLKLPSDAPMPEFLKAAASDPRLNTTGKISRDQAIQLATKDVDKGIAQVNLKQLSDYYAGAAKLRSQSALFAIDPFEITKLKTEGAVAASGFPGLFPGIARAPSIYANLPSPEMEAAKASSDLIVQGFKNTKDFLFGKGN